MYKKYIIFVIIVLMSLSLLWQVSGYSNAMIENLANISLTKSEDALIAVPGEMRFDLTVTKTDYYNETLYYEEDSGDEDTAEFDVNPVDTSRERRGTSYDLTIDSFASNKIKNNMSKKVEIIEIKALENENFISFNGIPIQLSPGEKANISSREKGNGEIVIEVIDTEESLYQNYSDKNKEIPIIILAEWEGGQAEIECSVILCISTEKETVTSTTEEVRPAPKDDDEDDETIYENEEEVKEEDEENKSEEDREDKRNDEFDEVSKDEEKENGDKDRDNEEEAADEDEENGDGEKSVDKNDSKNGAKSSDVEEKNEESKENEQENEQKENDKNDSENENNLEEEEEEEEEEDEDDNEEEEEKDE